jgi:hypothetical protein
MAVLGVCSDRPTIPGEVFFEECKVAGETHEMSWMVTGQSIDACIDANARQSSWFVHGFKTMPAV